MVSKRVLREVSIDNFNNQPRGVDPEVLREIGYQDSGAIVGSGALAVSGVIETSVAEEEVDTSSSESNVGIDFNALRAPLEAQQEATRQQQLSDQETLKNIRHFSNAAERARQNREGR